MSRSHVRCMPTALSIPKFLLLSLVVGMSERVVETMRMILACADLYLCSWLRHGSNDVPLRSKWNAGNVRVSSGERPVLRPGHPDQVLQLLSI